MRSKNGGAKAPSTTTANPKLDQTIKDGNNSRPPETTASMNKKSLGRPTVKLLPPETREAVWTRTFVVAAFWCVVLFLGLPMWWKTTSVYREKIPLDEMQDWADGNVCQPVFPLHVSVHAPSIPGQEAHHLIQSVQHSLDDLNDFGAYHLRLHIAGTLDDKGHNESIEENAALSVRLVSVEDENTPRSELRRYLSQLDIFYSTSQFPSVWATNSGLTTFMTTELQKIFSEEKAMIAYILSNSNTKSPTPHDGSSMASNYEQGEAVMHAAGSELSHSIIRRATKAFKYAETYHLTFSLFTPGGAPSAWDIEASLQEYLIPLLDAFSPTSNFSIDTQVQLYASSSPLAPEPEYNKSLGAWTMKTEDLGAFINAAEWPLTPNIGKSPTINFILYVPSPLQSPLIVKETKGTSWLIPQWGGVFILNPDILKREDLKHSHHLPSNPDYLSEADLKPAISIFAHQLMVLLGVPGTPSSLALRLQTLVRVHTASLLLSASSTMGSLARLTRSLSSIPIPPSVANSVAATLSHLSSTCDLLRNGHFDEALAAARVAENEAEKGFFEKSMLGQAYFPDEHKLAVYLPLLGPVGVPLVLGLLREVRRIVGDLKDRNRAS